MLPLVISTFVAVTFAPAKTPFRHRRSKVSLASEQNRLSGDRVRKDFKTPHRKVIGWKMQCRGLLLAHICVAFVDDDLTIPGNEVPKLIFLVKTRDRFGLLSAANMTNRLRGKIEKRQSFLPLVAQERRLLT